MEYQDLNIYKSPLQTLYMTQRNNQSVTGLYTVLFYLYLLSLNDFCFSGIYW